MASNSEAKENPGQLVGEKCMKIIVVGDKGCGKTSFIERFAKRLRNEMEGDEGLPHAIEYSTEDLFDVMRVIKVVEIPSVTEELVNSVTKDHGDANGIMFMYAIDDPSGFEALPRKWIQNMEDNGCKTNQATILIGNKEDARNNQQVIERLAEANQALVTSQQGENLKDVKGLQRFYEISAPDENDSVVHVAFRSIVFRTFQHWEKINILK